MDVPAEEIIDAGGAARAEPSAGAPRVEHLSVDAERAGQRLDNFLIGHLKGVPKSHVYRIIRSGEVRVNGGRASARSRLQEGDVLRVPPVRRAPARSVSHAAPAREFTVVHEDAWLLAVDKPSGVAVHGGSGVSSGVIEQLRSARPDARMLELVHRLDRGTSGLLLIAKRRSALRRLQEQFRQRRVDKTYLALVLGDWPDGQTVIDVPLHKFRTPDGQRKVRTTTSADPRGQRAISLVRVRERWPGFSLLEVGIKTGRTHQIRVHLAARGHPVAGDERYGDFAENRRLRQRGLGRLFLHAWRLRFEHSNTGEELELECSLPDDLPLPPQWDAD